MRGYIPSCSPKSEAISVILKWPVTLLPHAAGCLTIVNTAPAPTPDNGLRKRSNPDSSRGGAPHELWLPYPSASRRCPDRGRCAERFSSRRQSRRAGGRCRRPGDQPLSCGICSVRAARIRHARLASAEPLLVQGARRDLAAALRRRNARRRICARSRPAGDGSHHLQGGDARGRCLFGFRRHRSCRAPARRPGHVPFHRRPRHRLLRAQHRQGRTGRGLRGAAARRRDPRSRREGGRRDARAGRNAKAGCAPHPLRGSCVVSQSQSALLTDLYQLTMLQAYFDEGMQDTAVFEFFVRALPPGRNFLLAAGLEQVLCYLEQFHVTELELDCLRAHGGFREPFLAALGALRFTGDVHALPEGTACFINEPMLRITAPISQAQVVESRLLSLVHLSTLIASKAARSVLVAPGKLLVDFGMRRAHGAEAGLLAARAAYLAGFSGTATVLAGIEFGVPVFGTMAHSYIEAHADEISAFKAFARSFPANVVLLIDTD